MNVLILHGILGSAGENWGRWLHDSLLEKGYKVIMPTLPNSDHPDRQEWLEAIKRVTPVTNDLIIVAHSLGVTSALDFIEQSHSHVKALVSLSGFAEDYGLELNSYFLKEKNINFDKVNKQLSQAFVLFGEDDPYVPQRELSLLAKSLNVTPEIIKNGGHLNAQAGFKEFPKLLEIVLSIK